MVGTADLLSPEWIEKVATTTDNDLRAHRVALTYSQLARHLDELIHEGEIGGRLLSRRPGLVNANFFHFATWGTLTVTHNIGNERPPQRLNVGLGLPLRRRLTPAVLRARAADAQVVGRALAWGQRLIFASACLVLHEFSEQLTTGGFAPEELLEQWPKDGDTTSKRPDPDSTVGRILELTSSGGVAHEPDVADGDRPPVWFERDRHFAPVLRAFELYGRACAPELDPVARARLVLGGNLLLTAVEQDLVDPALSFVVDLVPRRLGAAFDWRMARLAEQFRRIPTHLSYLVLQSLHEDERRTFDLVWSRLMTDQVLVMALPTETLRLGRDIPPWRRDQPYFPADLRDLDEIPASGKASGKGAVAVADDLANDLVDVARLVKSLDRTIGNGRGSAARDWRRWDERMNWAVTLMRSRQHDETLYWRPYSEADACRIVVGELPHRMGDPSALEVQPPLDPRVFERADLVSRQQRR
jgi:hypothetical protein